MRCINVTVWTKNPQLIKTKIEEVLPDFELASRGERPGVTIIPAAETVQVVTSKHTLGDMFMLAHMLAKLTDGRILVDVGSM